MAALALLPAALPAPAAANERSIRVTAPRDGAQLSGGAHFKAVSRGRPARVVFYVDGKRRATDPRLPWRLGHRLDTRGLADGRHRLMVRAVWPNGRVKKHSVTVDVRNGASSAASAPADPGSGRSEPEPDRPGPRRTWSDGFESGDFRGWSWWGQGQESIWGHIAVVDPAAQGVPAAERSRIGRFETTQADIDAGRNHAKLYKAFSTGTGASVRPPSNVSGTYRVRLYVPRTYRVPGETWVNVLQFKEKYRRPEGAWSDPLWWIQFGNGAFWHARGGPAVSHPDAPVAFMNRWQNPWSRKPKLMAVPLDRWFELRAELRQGERIDFYLDGRPLDTALASEYPVSPFHGSASIEWIFGVGNYSTAANGPLYADDASYTPH